MAIDDVAEESVDSTFDLFMAASGYVAVVSSSAVSDSHVCVSSSSRRSNSIIVETVESDDDDSQAVEDDSQAVEDCEAEFLYDDPLFTIDPVLPSDHLSPLGVSETAFADPHEVFDYLADEFGTGHESEIDAVVNLDVVTSLADDSGDGSDSVRHDLDEIDPIQFLQHQATIAKCTILDVCRTFKAENPGFVSGKCVRAHMDGGAEVTITDQLHVLFAYRKFKAHQTVPRIRGIDKVIHFPVGYGYIRIPDCTRRGFTDYLAYYCPTLEVTIFSPFDAGKRHGCRTVSTLSFIDGSNTALVCLQHCKRRAQDITISGTMSGGLLFSPEFILPSAIERQQPLPKPELSRVSTLPCAKCLTTVHTCSSDCACKAVQQIQEAPLPTRLDEPDPFLVHATTREQQRLLWHQRLCHIHSRRMSDLWKCARGVPRLAVEPEGSICPICAHGKSTKADRSTEDSNRATVAYQGLSVDFGFVVQKGSNEARHAQAVGLNGETCYCLIVDHHSKCVFSETFASKAPPIAFLTKWLSVRGAGPSVTDKYVLMDKGGDLGQCREVWDLFESHGYRVKTTATNASSQNGLGERPHRTIADGVRTMLHGAGLPLKFWPYAFHHFIRMYNFTPHGESLVSPYEIVSKGQKPRLNALRTFGCRMYVNSGPRSSKLAVDNVKTGIFLGFAQTSRNFLFYNLETKKVESVVHATFDELMNDLPYDDKPPNARLLSDAISQGRPITALNKSRSREDTVEAPVLDFTENAFTDIRRYLLPTSSVVSDPMFGLRFQRCSKLYRAYLADVLPSSPLRSLMSRSKLKGLIGSYVVRVNDAPVFSVSDVESVLDSVSQSASLPAVVPIELALEPLSTHTKRQTPLHLRIHDLERVHMHRMSGTREGSVDGSTARVFQTAQVGSDSDTSTTSQPQTLNNRPMTDEERALNGSFTYRKLQTLPIHQWLAWRDGFDEQLDDHYAKRTFGDGVPIDKPPGATVLRPQWAQVIKKESNRRKCRLCCDGSKRAAPEIHAFAETYASCIEQPCLRAFYAIAAVKGFVITGADCTNAYANAPSPTKECYLLVDDAYIDWYTRRFPNRPVPRRGQVLPIQKALQGHPEAGALWEKHIVSILLQLGFRATTHERNLYFGVFNGEPVYAARQVDDFAFASKHQSTALDIIERIRGFNVEIRREGDICRRFNGVDVDQTRNYIRIHCKSYIARVLASHGWDTPSDRESDRHDETPITDRMVKDLSLKSGPSVKINPAKHQELQDKMKFPYRQVLGELIYAYVICRLDIGFAITFLARFAECPHEDHYRALLQVCKYLRATSDWGLMYWREEGRERLDLPVGDFVSLSQADVTLPDLPSSDLLTTLHAYMDASYGTDYKTRKSISGYAICYGGAAICYKSSRQTITALSSTEAEFIASVSTAKKAKYLRAVFAELDLAQTKATPLFCDNESCINIVNNDIPTDRSRHIDIRYFAIQEWRRAEEIELKHIPGVVNPADALTKATGPTLHHRHSRRAMGHYGVF